MTLRDKRRPRSDWPYQKGRDPFGRIPPPPPDDPIEIMRRDWEGGRLGRHPVKRLLDIRGGIGRGEINDRIDVGGIETLLSRTGHRDLKSTSGPTGLFGSPQENAIRGFQKDHGLRQDGIMRPGGETQTALAKILTAAKKPATTFIPHPERRTTQASRYELRAQAKPAQPEQAREKPDATPESERAKQDAKEPQPSKMELDRLEAIHRGYVAGGRLLGLDRAADNLERFLEGKGGTVKLTRDEARKIPQIRKAEIKNQGFIVDTMVGKEGQSDKVKKHWHPTLKRLIDGGEPVPLETDHMEGVIKARYELPKGNIDFALGIGNTHVTSTGELSAARRGNTIFVDGKVSHEWKEPYDFHKGKSGADDALKLQKYRGAKPFNTEATWEQEVNGTLTIENGELTNPRFRWTDLDKK